MLETLNRKALSILMRGQIPVREPDHVREAQQERRQDYSRYRTQKDDSGNGAPANDPTKQDTASRAATSPSCGRKRKWDATTPVPAAAAKNTRTATARDCKSIYYWTIYHLLLDDLLFVRERGIG